ncbi:pyridoxal phosphate-dependent aminotransferase [Frigidibacter sp. ROC022]|uniref:pyridoxal phosphate-dependent aminotransferase n=1 Tax=Frigidibacter sp. ROC022 TaxID=2971796 RepID=UPI00215B1194|nr:pyridoxal phosphate-dependent aminotransferase [Frigidibacter sp. ROC022]MCR8723253.1 pyridoxal phosphate-dependent aminotransferase [Frigidibacter sp. ROC022]
MQLSRQISGIHASGPDGWDAFRRARAMARAGEPVIELTIGEHDIRTDPQILDAMHRAALAGATGYPAIPGILPLREAVAARVSERTGVPTGVENVLIVPGGQAGLFAAHHAVCDPGDKALICDPYYATYPGTVRAVGGRPVAVPCRPGNGFRPDPADILARASGARSLLINSPNNPTGVIYDRATLDGIAGAVREADLWLISDEVYDTQVWEGRHLSPRALPDMAERTIVIGSMSKSHAMTGSRIGWVVAPEPVIAAMDALATNTTYGVAGFVQVAALFALSLGAGFEAEIAEPFRRRRALARALLEAQNVVRLIPSGGAMYLMLDIRATGLDGNAFADALLEAEKIGVMPGESFGQAAAGHIRVALTVADDRFTDALSRLLAFAARLAAAPEARTARLKRVE